MLEQCYFLLSVSPAVPVLYYVTNIRDGKSYRTRTVRAVQHGVARPDPLDRQDSPHEEVARGSGEQGQRRGRADVR